MTLLTWLAVWVLASFLLAPLFGAALRERGGVRVPVTTDAHTAGGRRHGYGEGEAA